jgi:hypothetical protein
MIGHQAGSSATNQPQKSRLTVLTLDYSASTQASFGSKELLSKLKFPQYTLYKGIKLFQGTIALKIF